MERGFVFVILVHEVLQTGNFFFGVSLGPSDVGSLVHFFAVSDVELRGDGSVSVFLEIAVADFGIFVPQIHIFGKRVKSLESLSLPFRIFFSSEDLVGHIFLLDDGARTDSGNRLPGSRQVQNRLDENFETILNLFRTTSGFVGLRIVNYAERGTGVHAVGFSFVFHTANATGDSGVLNHATGSHGSVDGGQNGDVVVPFYESAFSVDVLTGAPIGGSVESFDGKADFRKVGGQKFVGRKLRLYGIEHRHRGVGFAADYENEVVVAV